MYIRGFFVVILFYILIILNVVFPIDKDTKILLTHVAKQSFIIGGWEVVYGIGIGKIVVSDDGKFLQYKCIKPTYKRRWYR